MCALQPHIIYDRARAFVCGALIKEATRARVRCGVTGVGFVCARVYVEVCVVPIAGMVEEALARRVVYCVFLFVCLFFVVSRVFILSQARRA